MVIELQSGLYALWPFYLFVNLISKETNDLYDDDITSAG
jgi:hypothetical protein